MFICSITQKVTHAGEAQNKITLKARQRVYKNWDAEREEYWESFGTEIVKEVCVSEEGLAIWNALTPEEQERLAQRLSK